MNVGIEIQNCANTTGFKFGTMCITNSRGPRQPQAVPDAGRDKQVCRPLLEHARADALFDVVATAVLKDDGVDSLELEQSRQRQSRGAGADDADLRALSVHPSSSTRWKTAKALFAAGTPQ